MNNVTVLVDVCYMQYKTIYFQLTHYIFHENILTILFAVSLVLNTWIYFDHIGAQNALIINLLFLSPSEISLDRNAAQPA